MGAQERNTHGALTRKQYVNDLEFLIHLSFGVDGLARGFWRRGELNTLTQ